MLKPRRRQSGVCQGSASIPASCSDSAAIKRVVGSGWLTEEDILRGAGGPKVQQRFSQYVIIMRQKTPLQKIINAYFYIIASLAPPTVSKENESVIVSGRGEDLSRNTNTHHLNENSSCLPRNSPY
ncbi:hypothetical protein DPX16_19964 [Anabarilius grahami]|uniref:Uncharacterized protein n=1 Tax=Anabarilius grahami TaxID=495550 RepID=A0A3N0XPJ1_ANAGA|nr:hypothetical protein DPX16_19964 [Anabarilius grahami]